jgi:hypothetical protein
MRSNMSGIVRIKKKQEPSYVMLLLVIKPRRMRWVGCVTCKAETVGAYKILMFIPLINVKIYEA